MMYKTSPEFWSSKIIHFWILHLLFCFKFLSQISRSFRPRTLEWSYYEHVWRASLSSESKYPMHRNEIYHLLSGEFTAMFLFQNWCNNNDAQNITWILNNYLNSLNDLSGLNSSNRLLILVVGSFLAPKWKMFLNFFIFRYTVPYADYWVCGVYEQPWAPSQNIECTEIRLTAYYPVNSLQYFCFKMDAIIMMYRTSTEF